jgi:hypothetical protein
LGGDELKTDPGRTFGDGHGSSTPNPPECSRAHPKLHPPVQPFSQ